MQEFLSTIDSWKGKSVYLARVIKTWGSAPRQPGSLMFVNQEGDMTGSVSGGCVEGAVVKQSLSLIDTNQGLKLNYGVSDEDAWSVGLSCGGSIQVYLQPFDGQNPVWQELTNHLRQNTSAILITSLTDGEFSNSLLTPGGDVTGDEISDALKEAALKAYDERKHVIIEVGGKSYFIQLFPRKPQLIIIGVAHITVHLVTLGKMYGFETIVIDPRGYFAERTAVDTEPDQLLQNYPSEVLPDLTLDAYTFCAILSHDPKIDDNALQVLLPMDNIGYIGALGSRKTHEKRKARLKEKGVSDELIERIHAPIGLPIGASGAREIALAVMGEIIQAKNQYS